MLHICYILFLICNFTDWSVKLFEKNINNIINIIDEDLLYNNLNINRNNNN